MAATVLLTGLPRSATTMMCALLNEAPDTLALVEPIEFSAGGDHDLAADAIATCVARTREHARTAKRAVSRQIDGRIPENIVVSPKGDGTGALRAMVAARAEVAIPQDLTSDFTLVIKHHGEFTAMSTQLMRDYPMFALVRHPLAALAAWQAVDMPIQQGHLRSAECYDPALRERLAAEPGRLERQVALIAWHFEHYAAFPRANVLRYEDLVEDPGRELGRMCPTAAEIRRVMDRHVPKDRYPVDMAELARALVPLRPVAEFFYPRFGDDLGAYL